MTYFDQVKPPLQMKMQTEQSLQDLNLQIQLLKRIEKRTMEVVEEKYPYMIDLVGKNPIIIDPYANYSPVDTKVWIDVFIAVQQKRELYARLFYIRGGGTKLIRNQRWGYVFEPVIGGYGWISFEEFQREIRCLDDYRDDVIAVLKKISNYKGA